MDYRCIAIDTAVAARFRHSGRDDGGNALITRVADARGYPCRHCLAEAGEGRRVLLGSFHVARPAGAFASASPIFVCAAACARHDGGDAIPDMFLRNDTLLSVRPYDREGFLLYDLNDVTAARGGDGLIRRALADERTDFINVHTARPGCFLFRVERA